MPSRVRAVLVVMGRNPTVAEPLAAEGPVAAVVETHRPRGLSGTW